MRRYSRAHQVQCVPTFYIMPRGIPRMIDLYQNFYWLVHGEPEARFQTEAVYFQFYWILNILKKKKRNGYFVYLLRLLGPLKVVNGSILLEYPTLKFVPL